MELDRKNFLSVAKYANRLEYGSIWNEYIILNDGYYVKHVNAENDADAVRAFNEYINSKSER